MSHRAGEKAPRILHCIPVLGGGGAERQLRNFLVHQTSKHHEHAVFAWKSGEFHDDIRERGIPIFHKESTRTSPWRPITGMIQAIRTWKPDLLQAWLPQTDIMASALGPLFGIPVVGSERNSRHLYQNVPEVKDCWHTKLRPWFMHRGMVAIIANSEAGGRYLRNDLGLSIPVLVIPNGLDLDSIEAIPPCDPSPFEDPSFSPQILTASRLVPHKRVEVILEAISILRSLGHRPALAICGAGPASAFIQRRIDELELGDQVRMLGHRSDVVAVMKRAQIFCTASEVEGMPNSVLEAMVCGLAIVASDIPEHEDLIGGADVGVLFRKGSAEDLAAKLAEVMRTPEATASLGANAAALAKDFSVERMVDRFEQFYQDMFHAHVRS